MKELTRYFVFFAGLLMISGIASGGDSWSISDPPIKDTTAGAAYCAIAKDQFLALYTYYRDTLATNGDLGDLYNMERMFDGMEGVYEVTGDSQVANKMLDISLKIVDSGDDLNDDGFLDYCFRDEYGNPTPPSPGDPACDSDPGLMCTYPWRAFHGVSTALRVAKSAGLDSSRPSEYAKLRTFVMHDVIDKWLDLDGPGPDTGQGGSHTTGIDVRMAGILLDTYYATGDPRLGEMAREWILWTATDMENGTYPGSYYFDNWILEHDTDSVADTEHANEIIGLYIEGFEAGFLPYSFIAPLHSTFLNVMWNQNLQSPLFREYVDGTGAWQDRFVVMGFMRLGQFKGQSQSVAYNIDYSTSYDLDIIQANGNLCRIYGKALTVYPLAQPQKAAYLPAALSASAGTAGRITCGSTTCNISAGQKCCTESYGSYSGQRCASSCSYTAIACDGPEDCGGKACCGIFGGWGCSSVTACSTTQLQLCHTSADCPVASPYCCANTGLPGLYNAVCSQFDCSENRQTTTSTTLTTTSSTTTSHATTSSTTTSHATTTTSTTTTRASTTSTTTSHATTTSTTTSRATTTTSTTTTHATTTSSTMRTTTSTTSTTMQGSTTTGPGSTTTRITTTTLQECIMPGNMLPCGEVTLNELILSINKWAVDELSLASIINLINSWSDPARYPSS
jgi:hypothetical protein